MTTAFRQPREPTVSIERARKLGARNYDGIGDPEKAWLWLEGNERVFNVMGCYDEQMARIKISVNTDISVIRFYGYIGNIGKYRWIFLQKYRKR